MNPFRRQRPPQGDETIPDRGKTPARTRAAGGFFRAATRITGLKPAFVPAHLRRQFAVVGIDDETLARVLGSLKRLADWPYAWEAAGDEFRADGDVRNAALAYYMGQRVLLTPSPLKTRLYRLALDAYHLVDQPALEELRVPGPAGTIAGYLQVPNRPAPAAGFPLVLMLPGVTATKEELHPFAEPLLARGYAVARIDNPGYGETEGVLRHDAMRNGAHVLDALATDSRLDADSFHIFSMSLGGFCAMHSSIDSRAQSLTIIASPIEPHVLLVDLPDSNITAIKHMTGYTEFDDVYRLNRDLSMRDRADQLTIPVRIFHGGRDQTIPVAHAQYLEEALAGDVVVTIYERDHHNCLEHFDEIIAHTLEWLEDPTPVIERYQAEQRVAAAEAAATSVERAHSPQSDVGSIGDSPQAAGASDRI